MKKNKVPELKTCVECGGVLEITDNLGYHTEPKTCIRTLREKIYQMSLSYLNGVVIK